MGPPFSPSYCTGRQQQNPVYENKQGKEASTELKSRKRKMKKTKSDGFKKMRKMRKAESCIPSNEK